jgi:hypothetical protein
MHNLQQSAEGSNSSFKPLIDSKRAARLLESIKVPKN